MGISRVVIPGNGDCFFTSVGLSILTQLSALREKIQSRGITLTTNSDINEELDMEDFS